MTIVTVADPPAWALPLFAAIAAQGVAIAGLRATLLQTTAQLYNGSAFSPHHGLKPVPNAAGAMPVYFPPTVHEFSRLTHMQAAQLLAFYGLPPIAGNNAVILRQKQVAIAAYIGMRMV